MDPRLDALYTSLRNPYLTKGEKFLLGQEIYEITSKMGITSLQQLKHLLGAENWCWLKQRSLLTSLTGN